jgi:hypothetical protein
MTGVPNQIPANIQDAIRDVLISDWDPAQAKRGGPRDEYDTYLPLIYQLLVSNPTRVAVATALKDLDRDIFGYPDTSIALLLPAADKLIAIDLHSSTDPAQNQSTDPAP